ncbi:hypothetical protein K4A83_19560 [Spirulina subsalsa FACHB-351]|uniref:Uncharacterized protein n=1 Tax=Spirulina subsalsa FACHB-351 TaxID=234711 RepID=A0ABT3LAB4_9CYAN|nr:hypothetical protein [Spirulina subsalsa]MCW6038453.1 hypothetical protein [Spirulina subsalsa FACHB-351]
MTYFDLAFLKWLGTIRANTACSLDYLSIRFHRHCLIVETISPRMAEHIWAASVKASPQIPVRIYVDSQLYVKC